MTDTNERPNENRIKSIDTTVEILETIQRRDGAGVTEIADSLGVSKSNVHSHLRTLLEHRFVVKDGDTYRLGLRFLNFGGFARQRQGLYSIIKPEVDELAQETGETAQVMTEEHGRGIYLYQAKGQQAVRTDSYIGTDVCLHCTAVGKALLAHLSRERVEEIIDRHGLPKKTPDTITDQDVLFERLETIRDRGYAFDDGERIDGIRCVAAPITKDDGTVVGSLSVSGPKKRIHEDYFREELPKIVQEATRVIEINVTYT
jgi:DNA-binding IclR family transcriptional regulator